MNQRNKQGSFADCPAIDSPWFLAAQSVNPCPALFSEMFMHAFISVKTLAKIIWGWL